MKYNAILRKECGFKEREQSSNKHFSVLNFSEVGKIYDFYFLEPRSYLQFDLLLLNKLLLDLLLLLHVSYHLLLFNFLFRLLIRRQNVDFLQKTTKFSQEQI